MKDKEEDIESSEESLQYMIEPPRDLHELYMRLRAQLSSSKTLKNHYMKMLSVVDVGVRLLPNVDSYQSLAEEVNAFLSSKDAYPGKRQMERSGDSYRMGTDSTGLIIVSREDIGIGQREVLEQQASAILPRLKEYDNEIMKILIEERVVDTKKPILEDLLIDQTIEELGKMISNRG